MNCACCKFLIDTEKQEGDFMGAKYYCKKNKCFINGDCKSCNNFQKSYSRSNSEIDQIYEDGKIFSDDTKEPSFYMTLLIFIIILGSLITLFNNLNM